MYIVLVHIHVKDEFIEDFCLATIDNAKNSVLEPGIARFDFIQNQEDKTQFILIEVYRNMEAANRHKETDHYLRWRDTVKPMMAEDRIGIKYKNIYPEEYAW